MKTVYTMPKWAIDLVTMAKGNDTYESRLLAHDVLQSQQDCPDGLAEDIVYNSKNCTFEESPVFGKEEREGFTHAVFNGKDHSAFKSGKLYPVCEVTDTSFECKSEGGNWLFCLRKDCAFVEPAQWTLVKLESE
jgi:hypothetical protein